MTKTSEPIVFFGSGPVAAESLRLLAQDFVIEAVVTKPRPEHHKGDVPVLTVADRLGLSVKTASNKAELDRLFQAKPFKSRLGVLIDFGIIVSQAVIDYFSLGIINSHFSLLPEWRGADPISFSILSGQKQTGVSFMLLNAALDEGLMIGHTISTIKPRMTTPELTKALTLSSYEGLRQAIPRYLAGEVTPITQEEVAILLGKSTTPTYSRKLTKEDGLADWHKPAEELERQVRAFIDWPKSYFTIGTLELVITRAHVVHAKGEPGQRAIIDKLPVIYCGQGALAIDQIKPAGKQEMTGQSFLAGYKDKFLA